MRFQFETCCRKSFDKLDRSVQARIIQKLAYWIKSPNPLRYADPLEGHSSLQKYRVGNYRIIVFPRPKEGIITILKVGHRGNIYKHLEKLK
ncbi:MAG: type II toxin-antitoxin system RelE/ParE family toxin [Candidatus Peregrinibacteria bacterium]